MNLSRTSKFKQFSKLDLSNPNYKRVNRKDDITVTIETKKVIGLFLIKQNLNKGTVQKPFSTLLSQKTGNFVD